MVGAPGTVVAPKALAAKPVNTDKISILKILIKPKDGLNNSQTAAVHGLIG